MSAAGGWVLGGLVVAGLLVAGGGWEQPDGPRLDEQAVNACAAVRTHERARGEALQERSARAAVAAAGVSEVEGLRRDAAKGLAGVAAWCRQHG